MLNILYKQKATYIQNLLRIDSEQKMNTLVFDLETTGFPKYRNAKPFNSYAFDTSRIIEIGYVLMDSNGEICKKVEHFVKYSDDLKIENSHIHGISANMVNEYGISMDEMFDELTLDLQTVDTMVAHNIEFDFNVLLSEVYRKYKNYKPLLGLLYSKDLICTMQMGRKYMVNKKFPKLVELNKILFDTEWVQTHRALDDVLTCAKCYQKMITN